MTCNPLRRDVFQVNLNLLLEGLLCLECDQLREEEKSAAFVGAKKKRASSSAGGKKRPAVALRKAKMKAGL